MHRRWRLGSRPHIYARETIGAERWSKERWPKQRRDQKRRRSARCRNGICRDLYPGPRQRRALARDLDPARRGRRGLSRSAMRASSPTLSGAELGAAIAAYERLQEHARPGHELRLARPCRRHARPRDRPLLPDHAGAGQRHLDRAAVLHARAQPHRRRGARRRSWRRRSWRITRRGCATCAPSGRISSATRSKSCCTRNRSPAAPPGRGSSTRPMAGAALSVSRQGPDRAPRR